MGSRALLFASAPSGGRFGRCGTACTDAPARLADERYGVSPCAKPRSRKRSARVRAVREADVIAGGFAVPFAPLAVWRSRMVGDDWRGMIAAGLIGLTFLATAWIAHPTGAAAIA